MCLRCCAGRELTTCSHMAGAYERKGHHYSVQDTATYDEHGRLLLQQRHTNIFRPAKKPGASL